MFGLIVATVLLRCPRCHRGALYRKNLHMNKNCAVCGLQYMREEGYFIGAMYASYFFQFATIIPVMLLLLMVSRSPFLIAGILSAQALIQVPIAYLYSRAIWMAVDTHFDPLPAWDGTPPSSQESNGTFAGV